MLEPLKESSPCPQGSPPPTQQINIQMSNSWVGRSTSVAPDSFIVFIGISTKVVIAHICLLVFVRPLFRPPLAVISRDRLCYFSIVMFTNIIIPIQTICWKMFLREKVGLLNSGMVGNKRVLFNILCCSPQENAVFQMLKFHLFHQMKPAVWEWRCKASWRTSVAL